MKYGIYLIYLLMAFMLSSCDWFQMNKKNEVKIGIIVEKDKGEETFILVDGAELAVKEINSKGGLLGRKVVLIPQNDKGDVNEGLVIANNLSQTPGIMAVIGHLKSDVTIPASSVYESADVIMMTLSTSNLITEKKRNYIYRLIPGDKDIGTYLAQYSKKQNFKNIIIFYPRNEYGQDLANSFESEATDLGINIADRRSYFEQVADYSRLLDYWKRNYQFDSIFLIGNVTDGGTIINQIRQAGINVPIIAGDSMSTAELIEIAGKNAEGIVVVDFADDKPLDVNNVFRKNYLQIYSKEPGATALLGYDAIMLLANAVNKTQSLSNKKIAEYLHQNSYEGLVTKYQFDEYGNNSSYTKPYLKKIISGGFVLIDGPGVNKKN
jgi:branched-chain amino acid transport system substrate-binding protein